MQAIHLIRLFLIAPLFLVGCTSMPISTMYKLSRMDPMEADPEQIKVAIRADNGIGIREGGANIELSFEAEDDSLNISETFIIEIIRDPAFRTELYSDKKASESITTMGLTVCANCRLHLHRTRMGM